MPVFFQHLPHESGFERTGVIVKQFFQTLSKIAPHPVMHWNPEPLLSSAP
jgi:hypothetical protein